MEATADKLWEDYFATKDERIRNQLVREYIKFVPYIVGRMMVKPPNGMDREDLNQWGVYGLIQAIERFNPNQDAKFETYAAFRIKGYVIDKIRECGRSSGGPSRTVIKKSKVIDSAIKELETKLHRHPKPNEIADKLGVPEEEYYKMLDDIGILVPVSLDKLVGMDENLPASEVVKDESSIDPEESKVREEYYRMLGDEIEKLPEKERIIVTLYYYHEMTLKEIGQYLTLSESRISQLHTQAIFRLKNKIQEEG